VLVDASVARSFAVLGWTRQLVTASEGKILADRDWRHSMGAKSRRLDAGESALIAIAATRSLAFASDDEDALTLWAALTGSPGLRTRDLLWRLVRGGFVGEGEAKSAHLILQTDDLHNLGGPAW
jgi:hypothetical protein